MFILIYWPRKKYFTITYFKKSIFQRLKVFKTCCKFSWTGSSCLGLGNSCHQKTSYSKLDVVERENPRHIGLHFQQNGCYRCSTSHWYWEQLLFPPTHELWLWELHQLVHFHLVRWTEQSMDIQQEELQSMHTCSFQNSRANHSTGCKIQFESHHCWKWRKLTQFE